MCRSTVGFDMNNAIDTSFTFCCSLWISVFSLTMSENVNLRLARRTDLPAMARIANAANAGSELHRRMAPLQDQHPLAHYHWRLNLLRERLVTPNMRIMVAEDPSTHAILGFACWSIEGSDSALYKQWVGQSTWSDWLEGTLVWAERTWCKYAMDRSIDYGFMDRFMAVFQGPDQPTHPDCLHVHLINISPDAQFRGVGRSLIDWGKTLAASEELPLYLEANLEATGFYEKGGFSRLSQELMISPGGQEPIRLPRYVWEGEQKAGHWLERDADFSGSGDRWRWKDSCLHN